MSSLQRKNGVGPFFHPAGPGWSTGRRYTSPSPALGHHKEEPMDGHLGLEGPLGKAQVEAFLDDHPDFMESYVLRKVDRPLIDKWIASNKQTVNNETNLPNFKINDDPIMNSRVVSRKASEGSYLQQKHRKASRRGPYSADCTPESRRSSCATPHRKVSAATFASGCESPLLTTTEDGELSFLTIPTELPVSRERKFGIGQRPDLLLTDSHLSATCGTCERPLYQVSHLHDELISNLDVNSLALNIARNIGTITRASSVSILQVRRSGERNHLVAAALNVEKDSKAEDCLGQTLALDQRLLDCLLDLAAESRTKSFPVEEVKETFDETTFLHEDTSQVTVLPLPDAEGRTECLAILCLGPQSPENIEKNRVLNDYCNLAGKCMKNASDFSSTRLDLLRSQVLLNFAKVINEQETSIEHTAFKILLHCIEFIQCQRAQVQLFDKGSSTASFDLDESDFLDENFGMRTEPYQNRFLQNSKIVSLVAERGETVNIGEVSNDERLDDNLNSDAHFVHRTMLCMPLRDSDNDIIGVVTLINKKIGCFTNNDEVFVEAFGVFAGHSLENVSKLEQIKQTEARCQVALDIMSYHASSSVAEAEELSQLETPSSLQLRLQMFSFTDLEMEDMDTLKASLRMFKDLGLTRKFKLEHKTLCRWLLTVKKNYRTEVAYHNWRHAFQVAQVMFSSLCHSEWWSDMGYVTCLGLMIACLCHDLDHRGTNNNFQLNTDSPFARLYSTSTLERHHLNQTLVILNLEGNQILKNLNQEEYSATLAVVEEAILATDLSLHFQHLGTLKDLAAKGPDGLNWRDPGVSRTARAALMTAADLGATTKPWAMQTKVARLVAEEFWEQGDLERQLGKEPDEMMRRELQHKLAVNQVGFLDFVCLPVYRALSALSPALKPMEEAAASNRQRWSQLALEEAEAVDKLDEEEEDKENLVRNV